MDMDDRRDDEVHTYGPVLFRDEYTDAAAQRHACYVTLQGVSPCRLRLCCRRLWLPDSGSTTPFCN